MRFTIIALSLILATSGAMARGHHPKHNKQVGAPAAFTTESYLVADGNGLVLKEHDSNLQRPIASISKLMVGLLASKQDLDEHLPIPTVRTVQSNIPRKQTTLTRRELLTMALIKSDNFASQILCNNIPDCVNAMNAKAVELGMLHTYYAEPTGLSIENVSTANDLLKLMLVASTNQTITSLSSMSHAEIQVGKNTIRIKNTNPLTDKLDVILSKTGFTNPAGGCIVMAVNSPFGQRFLVLLGSRNTHTRIPEMEKLYRDMS
jgi:D-alanyl-D-alanine endopeptidase (penicillin-binding protein 7)